MSVLIPISKSLYHDMVRMSDGRLAPEEWVEHGFMSFLESLFLTDPSWFDEKFGSRAEEFLRTHLPDVARPEVDFGRPLFWKTVTVPAGSEVRMAYNGRDHFALVRDGSIVDGDGSFSPSEWVSKIANFTSRNAWRDIWFKFPGRTDWVLAQSLRRA